MSVRTNQLIEFERIACILRFVYLKMSYNKFCTQRERGNVCNVKEKVNENYYYYVSILIKYYIILLGVKYKISYFCCTTILRGQKWHGVALQKLTFIAHLRTYAHVRFHSDK